MRTNLKDSLQGIETTGKPRIIAKNTFQYIEKESGDTVIRFHFTNIIRKTLSGKTILNSGGYKTMTTKERIKEFSGFHIRQEKFIWYIGGKKFYDGMIFESPSNQEYKIDLNKESGE